jgi:hypothetical protein
MKLTFIDTYQIHASRNGGGWAIVKNALTSDPITVQFNGPEEGQHMFPSLTEINCEKCHSREKDQLVGSSHEAFSCDSCHRLNPGYHAANVPL